MRKIQIWHFRFFVIIFIGLLSGCWFTQQPESADNGSAPAELLYSGVYGISRLQEASATWISNHTALSELFKELNERRGGNGGSPPEMDFKSYGVLFLEMGQKSTGGFSINFNPSLTRVVGGQLAIHVDWVVPKEGKLVTQVVTSPFILLKIMHTNIDSILVWDQNMTSLFKIPIEA
jgi:hypothetical protein